MNKTHLASAFFVSDLDRPPFMANPAVIAFDKWEKRHNSIIIGQESSSMREAATPTALVCNARVRVWTPKGKKNREIERERDAGCERSPKGGDNKLRKLKFNCEWNEIRGLGGIWILMPRHRSVSFVLIGPFL